MNILVVGCGELGSRVAIKLDEQGHEVSIIAEKQSDADTLVGFNGFITIGIAIDQDVLIKSGITDCDVVIVVTDSDNVNMMVSQMAKRIYNVNDVQARASEQSMISILKKLGIKMICPTEDSTDKICSSIDDIQDETYNYIGTSTITTKVVDIDEKYIGVKALDVQIPSDYITYGVLKPCGKFVQINNRKNIIVDNNDKLVINRIVD